MTSDKILEWILVQLGKLVDLAPQAIDVRAPLSQYGLDSLTTTRLISDLSRALGRPLSPTIAWEYPTIESLVAYLTRGYSPVTPDAADRWQRSRNGSDEPIAIVGVACRFPGAPNIEAFTKLLMEGRAAISDIPSARWNVDAFYDPDPHAPGKMRTKRGAFIEHVDQFEPQFFGISPREAIQMDPQQRLALELAWEALESAGIPPLSLAGQSIGSFWGAIWTDYADLQVDDFVNIANHSGTGQSLGIIASRIAYFLGLHGPAMTIDTACSSALVAVHLACGSLRRGESRIAIAGGVSLMLSPRTMVKLTKFGGLAPDGVSKAFDANADGFGRGEGGGVVVLKPLYQALRDGDSIHAIIRGSAINNDGASNGLTAPNPKAQEAVLRDAYKVAGVDPSELHYVEAHGTGTLLGDPIEVSALGAILGKDRHSGNELRIGSVKTNIGHLEGAAGIAGLIKVTLAMNERALPPSLHFYSPNPNIPFATLGVEVQREVSPWPAKGSRLLAGVSSFGWGGTNAHIVLQSARQRTPSLGNDVNDIVDVPGAQISARGVKPQIVFVCSPQGGHWFGMAQELLVEEPAFRNAFVACERAMHPYLETSLLALLLEGRRADAHVDETDRVQPLILAIQIALAALWRSHGVVPDVLIGHSMGEITAAHLAGLLSLDDAARVICHFSRAQARTANTGTMAICRLVGTDLESFLSNYPLLSVAGYNDPQHSVLSGDVNQMDSAISDLASRGVFVARINVNVAAHHEYMDPILPSIRAALTEIETREPVAKLISTLTGLPWGGVALNGEYWARLLRHPVRFQSAVMEALRGGECIFVELSPHTVLTPSLELTIATLGAGGIVVSSLRREKPERAFFAASLKKVRERWTSKSHATREGSVLLPLSAKTPGSLSALARLYGAWLGDATSSLSDIAYTATMRRSHLEYRVAVVGATKVEIAAALGALAAGETPANVVAGRSVPLAQNVVFVFSGQGSQWVGMARQLYREEPVFRDLMAACDAAIRKEVGFSIVEEFDKPAETSRLHETMVAQPALFSIEVALSALLQSWGIVPSAVIGHSVGEVAAAYVSGMVDLAQAARLVCVRARVMQKATGQGKMVSVSLDEQTAKQAIAGREERIGIAAVNDMSSVVLSGDIAAIDSVVEKLLREGVQTRPLRVNYAFHSPQMEPLVVEFVEAVGTLNVKPGTIPMLSTVTGKPVTDGEIDADYWGRNIRQTVRFAEAIAACRERVFVEVGPHPVLATSIEQTLVAKNVHGRVIPTLRREKTERQQALLALGALYTEGVPIEWNRLYPEGGRVVDLPTYPWQRQRYWFDPPSHNADLRSAGLTSAQHPLLGAITRLADGNGVVLTGCLSLLGQPWLADHAVHEIVLVPGTALLELALAGARAVGQTSLSDLTLQAPLVLKRNGGARIQVFIQAPDGVGRRALSLYSQSDDAPTDSPWTRHASGILAESAPEKFDADLASWPPPGAQSVDLGDLYARLAARGYQYGPAFQGLKEVWRRGNELFARAALPDSLHKDAGAYGVHPALLDAALHSLVATSDYETEPVHLPFEFSDVAQVATGSSELRVRFELPLANAREQTISLFIADGAGQPVARVGALRLRPASAEQIRASTPEIERDMYRVEWLSISFAEASNPARGWVLGGDGRFAKELGLEWVSDINVLFDKLNRNEPAPERVTIDCTWAIAEENPLPYLVQRETAHALRILQILLAEARLSKTALIWLTRGAIATNPNDRVEDLARASLWGLIRSARSENPDRTLQLIDIDGSSGFAETFTVSREPELVWRYGTAFAPRLQRVAENADSLTLPHVPNLRLHLPVRGSLSDLAIIEATDAAVPLQRGQVRIAVHAAGVNFRDALNALGMVPAPWLGLELAGEVIEVGHEVAHISVGDRVMGLGQATFGTISIADARLVTRIPGHLSYVEAATIPLVFLTAFYALQDLGGIRRGERLLVHAAGGGVGMAAVQLARHWGVEAFGTASPGKWDMLRAMGLDAQHIANSRDLSFEVAFLNRTNGAGMDVVLNALAREFVDASLRLLPRGGRFLEMGKTDIRDADAVAKAYSGVDYRAFDLMDAGPERIQSMLKQLCILFEQNVLSPLPLSVYDMRQAPVAFKHLANGRNVGKLIMQPPRSVDAKGTSLITGGTGELGRSLAMHLVKKYGVKHIVLTSRRGSDAEGAESLVAALKEAGAETVALAACDIANSADVAAMIQAIPSARPLRAVFHLAGVLDDGLVTALTEERLANVLRPKVAGAWNLHECTKALDLSAFVLFSSVSGVMGGAGQANYAAANTFLDALAVHRRKQGLAGQSLAWGLWEQQGVGMTAHLRAADLARMQRQGFAPISVDTGLALLDVALARPEATLVPVRVVQYAEREDGTISPLIRGLVRPALHRARHAPVAAQALRQRLSGLSEAERREAVLDLVRREIVAVLGLAGVEGVPVERPLQQLGLDSLMAVELRNRLASRAEATLPATLAFDYPTAAAITTLLLSKLEPNTTSKWTTAEIQMKLQQVSIEALKKSNILSGFMALTDDHRRPVLETHDENPAIEHVDDDGILELLKKRLEGEGP